MIRYLVKRLCLFVPLLLVITLLSFCLVRIAPGGPFDRERAPLTPEVEQQLKARYHLDESLLKQYMRFLSGALQLDFGPSLRYRSHSVYEIIRESAPVSAILGLLAFGFALGFGLPIGFYTAARRGRWQDYTSSLIIIVMMCTPGFILAPILVLVLSLKLKLLPPALWGNIEHVVLPTIALGLIYAGRVARLFRGSLLEVSQNEFILLARAKGLPESKVLLRHVARLAILPVVTYCGPMLADLLTGSFVIENIFQIPGSGMMLVHAALNSDYTLVVGLVTFYAITLISLNLCVDVCYAVIDPRIRYE